MLSQHATQSINSAYKQRRCLSNSNAGVTQAVFRVRQLWTALHRASHLWLWLSRRRSPERERLRRRSRGDRDRDRAMLSQRMKRKARRKRRLPREPFPAPAHVQGLVCPSNHRRAVARLVVCFACVRQLNRRVVHGFAAQR